MSDQAPPVLRRRDAAQATLDHFRGKRFRFGSNDCVRMVAWHLRKLGHKVKLPPAGSYRSARSALKALRARGHASLAAALDAQGLERIAPAAAIVGDIVMGPGDAGFEALGVALGNGRIVGYHEDLAGAEVLQPFEAPIAAWKADPK